MTEKRRRPLIEAEEDVPGPMVAEPAAPASLRRPPRAPRHPSPLTPTPVPGRPAEAPMPRIATVPVDMLLALSDAARTAARCCDILVALSAENWEDLPPEIGGDVEYVSLRTTLERAVVGAPSGGEDVVRESWLVAASEAAGETRGEVLGVIAEIESWLRAGQIRRV